MRAGWSAVGKRAVVSAEIDQRITLAPAQADHAANEDQMIAALMDRLDRAFKMGEASGQQGYAAQPLDRFDTGETGRGLNRRNAARSPFDLRQGR